MDRQRHVRIRSRQVIALVAALSLVLHVGLMALATQPSSLPLNEQAVSAQNAHHAGNADGSHREDHGKTAGHAKPCCILSSINGMPAAPAGILLLPPHAVLSVPNFGNQAPSRAARLLAFYPVGARAPPALA
ncbi:hypothetical protein [Microvirga yunnanensis]|uniref:hypothetical protein n=1 Tax=Microvirga yunnanensis TaxID=2953740 RepID=UPI0021C6FB1F|nr:MULTISPECIES: hypothetical protein [unclassified Microvirga]